MAVESCATLLVRALSSPATVRLDGGVGELPAMAARATPWSILGPLLVHRVLPSLRITSQDRHQWISADALAP
jgi:hypothetical protein